MQEKLLSSRTEYITNEHSKWSMSQQRRFILFFVHRFSQVYKKDTIQLRDYLFQKMSAFVRTRNSHQCRSKFRIHIHSKIKDKKVEDIVAEWVVSCGLFKDFTIDNFKDQIHACIDKINVDDKNRKLLKTRTRKNLEKFRKYYEEKMTAAKNEVTLLSDKKGGDTKKSKGNGSNCKLQSNLKEQQLNLDESLQENMAFGQQEDMRQGDQQDMREGVQQNKEVKRQEGIFRKSQHKQTDHID